MTRRLDDFTPPPASGRTLPIEGREGGGAGGHRHFGAVASAKSKARVLRRNLTDAEAKLWVHLKRVSTVDTHFRKQVPIGNYIADFACLRGKLVVEVDGAQHGFASGVALHGATDASVRSMSKRKVLPDWAPSSPSMGEVSPKATEGVNERGGTF